MIKIISKKIWAGRRISFWLWIELLLVSVVLWYIIDWGYVNLRNYFRPLGFNVENTYLIRVGELDSKVPGYLPPEEKNTTVSEDFSEILLRLERDPDIEAVGASINASPYNFSNSYTNITIDTITINCLIRSVTPGFFDVFRYERVDGDNSELISAVFEKKTVVVNRDLLKKYGYSPGQLSNNSLHFGDPDHSNRIVAVTENVRYSDFDYNTSFLCYPLDKRWYTKENLLSLEISVRTKPDRANHFAGKFMDESDKNYRIGNLYIRSFESFTDIKNNFLFYSFNELKKNGWMIAFLLVNIFMGVVGTFWLLIRSQRRDIGVYLAFGCSRRKLGTQLVAEGLLLLLFAFLPAILVCINLAFADLTKFPLQLMDDPIRFITGILLTFLCLALMILIGIGLPARQAMTIEPARVLQEE